jgi:hypothetical protein
VGFKSIVSIEMNFFDINDDLLRPTYSLLTHNLVKFPKHATAMATIVAGLK